MSDQRILGARRGHVPHAAVGLAALALSAALSGCGQPGPLYLPPPAATRARQPAAVSPAAAPQAASSPLRKR